MTSTRSRLFFSSLVRATLNVEENTKKLERERERERENAEKSTETLCAVRNSKAETY